MDSTNHEARARGEALDALLRDRLAKASGRRSVPFATLVVGLLALGMAVVRVADGADGFLDGVVARAVTVHLILVSLPYAFAVARVGTTWPSEPGVLTLTRTRDVGDDVVASAFLGCAMRVAGARSALPSLLLSLEAVVLSLPDMNLAMRRMVSGALITLLGVLAAGALAALGALAARYGGSRARFWLVLVLVVPWVFVRVVPSAPREASPTGAYAALREAVLDAAAR